MFFVFLYTLCLAWGELDFLLCFLFFVIINILCSVRACVGECVSCCSCFSLFENLHILTGLVLYVLFCVYSCFIVPYSSMVTDLPFSFIYLFFLSFLFLVYVCVSEWFSLALHLSIYMSSFLLVIILSLHCDMNFSSVIGQDGYLYCSV